jgi:predicted ATP-grasp superfamily ATP-dependent carboligase
MHGLGDMLNVPTIPTVVLESKEDAEREASGKRNYPVVLKSRHSCVWKDGHGVKGCARFVFTKEELTREAESIARATGEWPLLQEFVPGDEYGIEYLFHKGAPLRMCAHRRIRSLSPSGGAAVVKETLAAEDPLAEIMDKHSQAILLALDWEGVAMVEWKHDERNGTLRLMELNGRFWGSLPLASYAGANFPAAFARLAMGEDIPRALLWREGVRSRHTLGDVRHLLSVLFARDPMRGIRYPSRLRAVWDFFSGLFSAKDDVWRMSDLGPGLWELVDILKTRIMRI